MKIICPHCRSLIEFDCTENVERLLCPDCEHKFLVPPLYGQIVYDSPRRTKDLTLFIRKVLIRQVLWEVLLVVGILIALLFVLYIFTK